MHGIRILIQCLIVGAAVLGMLSSILRKKKILALTGLLLATAAAALGGSSVRINETLHGGPAIGLDWFLLDLLLTAIIYVPLSKGSGRCIQSGEHFATNGLWIWVDSFMSTHLPIQILSFLILIPPAVIQFAKYLSIPGLQAHRATALVSAILSGRSSRGCRRIFYSLSVSQSPISVALSRRSPFFHGAGLALGIARSLL